MNKILGLICRQADFKKIVSIGFFAAFLAVFLSAGTAQAGFFDWFNLNKASNDSQQAATMTKSDYLVKVEIQGAGKVTSFGDKVSCIKKEDGSYKDKNNCIDDGYFSLNTGEIYKSNDSHLTAESIYDAYDFVKWIGSCNRSKHESAQNCKIEGKRGQKVTAVFQKKTKILKNDESAVMLTVKKTGDGLGKIVSLKTSTLGPITKVDGKINCKGIGTGSCTAIYKNCGTDESGNKSCGNIYLKATPDKGSTFAGWGDDCTSFQNEKDQCYVLLNGNKTVSAKFNKKDNDSSSSKSSSSRSSKSSSSRSSRSSATTTPSNV